MPAPTHSIEITTKRALTPMILPGTLAILAAVLIGFDLGDEACGGMLARIGNKCNDGQSTRYLG